MIGYQAVSGWPMQTIGTESKAYRQAMRKRTGGGSV